MLLFAETPIKGELIKITAIENKLTGNPITENDVVRFQRVNTFSIAWVAGPPSSPMLYFQSRFCLDEKNMVCYCDLDYLGHTSQGSYPVEKSPNNYVFASSTSNYHYEILDKNDPRHIAIKNFILDKLREELEDDDSFVVKSDSFSLN